MIEHQVQGWNECLPTSIAMCLGINKNELIETILLGTPYNFFAEIPGDDRARLLTEALGYWGETLDAAVGTGGDEWIEQVLIPLNSPKVAADTYHLLFDSAGLLTIWNDSRKVGHAVAFDHGLIFDPAHEGGPVPAEYWMVCSAMVGFHPFGIGAINEDAEP